MEYRRRSSAGKSSYMEIAIQLIKDLQEKKDLGTLIANSLDRTLFNEIRSVAWRIFLDILPSNLPNEWVNRTRIHRNAFETSSEKLVNEFKFIDGELKGEEAEKSVDNDTRELLNLISSIVKEEAIKSNIFDSLSESAQKIYLIWRREQVGHNFTKEQTVVQFKILLTLMFILYPSMIHAGIQDCDIPESSSNNPSPKDLLYFLNTEDYFDHDVLSLYTEIMKRGVLDCIIKSQTDVNINEIVAKVSGANNHGKTITEVISGLSREVVDVSFLLALADGELVKNSLDKGVNLSSLVSGQLSTLFYDVDIEILIYFWDCLLACEKDTTFDFKLIYNNYKGLHLTDFIATALLTRTNKDKLFENKDSSSLKIVYEGLVEQDAKDYILSALKLREKLQSLYED